jgi:hypothetical protein
MELYSKEHNVNMTPYDQDTLVQMGISEYNRIPVTVECIDHDFRHTLYIGKRGLIYETLASSY